MILKKFSQFFSSLWRWFPVGGFGPQMYSDSFFCQLWTPPKKYFCHFQKNFCNKKKMWKKEKSVSLPPSALFNFFFCTAQCHLDISASLCVFWILSLFSPGIHSSQLFHFHPPPTHHHNSHNILRENKLTTDGNSSSSLKIEIAIILVKVGAGGNKFSFFWKGGWEK